MNSLTYILLGETDRDEHLVDLSLVWVTQPHRMVIVIVLVTICYLRDRSADDPFHADFDCPSAVLRSVSRWVARGKTRFGGQNVNKC